MSRAGWARALEEHRSAVAALLETVERLDDATWSRPRAAGHWSPAQITEHLALAYEALLDELAGGPGMAPRLGRWGQRLSRWIVLPHILFHRSFPLRVRAPRETRPAGEVPARGAAVERLGGLALRFEQAVTSAEAARRSLTHPYFGAIPPLTVLRFCAVHLAHHHRQIRESASRTA